MPILKDSFQIQIYEMIKTDILEKKLTFGEQIYPKKIAKENGVSITPVRDALLQLVNDGLVINKERVGFYVRDFTRQEIIEIMEVRKMYELYCLKEYFQEIDRDKLAEIRDQMINYSNISKEVFYNADTTFHNLFVLASNNQFLISEFERVKNIFMLFIYFDTTSDKTASKEHIEIIDAILNKDENSSVNNLRNHLDRVKQVMISNHTSK